jgi:MiaB/RimO family radical SAM methylthiotransferase
VLERVELHIKLSTFNLYRVYKYFTMTSLLARTGAFRRPSSIYNGSLKRALRVLSTDNKAPSKVPNDGLTFHDFASPSSSAAPFVDAEVDVGASMPMPSSRAGVKHNGEPHVFHIRTYGCQMNVNDTDIVRSLLLEAGMRETDQETEADLLLTNTCAIREGAEAKVWNRLNQLRGRFQRRKVVGVLGCMAERLKEDLFKDGIADLVVGPDAYRDLPRLAAQLLEDDDVEQAVNVQLSLEETYADITPVRRNNNGVSAYVSIQRGCANRCSFCIVPFTRGQERSRPLDSIVQEIRHLHEGEGIKEVTLLGQNVNSFHDTSPGAIEARPESDYAPSNAGFRNRIRRGGAGYYFADLVEAVSDISPELRVRFTSPHPKDYPPELLSLMAERPNVCNSLHMPAQSGSSTMLERMKRGYTREAYLQLMDDVHSAIPDVAISSDFITGFCGETEDEHQDTLSLMEHVRYDQAFMFAYSMRGKTHAARTMEDDVPKEVKQRRLQEIIDTFHNKVQEKNNENEIGRLRLVLTEGESKRSKPGARTWSGRTDQNKRIVFPVDEDATCWIDDVLQSAIQSTRQGLSSNVVLDGGLTSQVSLQKGDYAVVEVTDAKGPSLRGRLLWRTSIAAFHETGLSKMDEESLRHASTLSTLLMSKNEEQRSA